MVRKILRKKRRVVDRDAHRVALEQQVLLLTCLAQRSRSIFSQIYLAPDISPK